MTYLNVDLTVWLTNGNCFCQIQSKRIGFLIASLQYYVKSSLFLNLFSLPDHNEEEEARLNQLDSSPPFCTYNYTTAEATEDGRLQ